MAHLTKEIEEFAAQVQEFITAHTAVHYPSLEADLVTINWGRRYAKIIRTNQGQHSSNQCCVYGFVDMHTGDIYKAAGWRGPAKHVRGMPVDRLELDI